MPKDDDLEEAISRLKAIKAEWVDSTLDYYTKRAPWHRRAFRISGTLVILMSVTIPFLVDRNWGIWSNAVVSALSLSVAALTGLMSFFQWQSSWHKHVYTQLRLEYLIALWELEMVEAQQLQNSNDMLKMATDATRKLVVASGKLTVEEAQEFLKTSRPPPLRESRASFWNGNA
ncbi:MAG: hypothetical protein QOF89_5819 [Acidobacteriota bacterium]|nr:hypothetical protein [Acidobacteriota bacterium]